ncbi:hypothetical protein RYX36_013065 [Vicia faba]
MDNSSDDEIEDEFLYEVEEEFNNPFLHFAPPSPPPSSSSQDQPDAIAIASPAEFTFNTSIASLHTYLGDVEDTRHRTAFLDGGAILNIPLFCLQGVVLFPGATLPLRVTVSRFVTAIERALSQVDVPYTIAVIRVHRETGSFTMKAASIGTTAVIRQYGRLEDGSMNVVSRGQQRFHLRRCWNDVDGVPYGEIQIIEEDLPLRTPRDAFDKSASSCNMLCSRVKMHGLKNRENELPNSSDMMDVSASTSDQEIRSNLDSRIGICSTSGKLSSKEELNRCYKNKPSHIISKVFLPHWVYRMYDSYLLAQKAAGSFVDIFCLFPLCYGISLLWLMKFCFSFVCWSFIIDFKI